ncbi:exonuclease domain-containing protein [Paenibacillus macerans]|uniref:exonuclease domain-containing protein n=1 Tax=Paenibacillus macerans TaxID=44252 RepID=UPI002040799C|nr:exonuclease domain-containing protein [Paenibacillus macerans]MCM3699835.1 exonuclease domain-containing protein [Paenibacillus macerans]
MKEPMKGNGGFWDALKAGGVPRIASMLGAPSAQQIAFVRSLTKGQRRPETLHVPLSELKTAVFDLETTGFHYHYGDEILSFGAVKVEGEDISEEVYYSLAKPACTIPERISELTGITPEMVRDAPALLEALREFMAFVDDRVLVAHGSAHDKAFLDVALWKTSKAHLGHRVLDTMMIARKLEPDRPISGLDDWLKVCGIPITRRHHALEDAKMTAQLWTVLVGRLKDRGVITLGDLYTFLSKT